MTSLVNHSLVLAYDIETYPNIFTIAFEHMTSDQTWFFEISDERNDYPELVKFIGMLDVNHYSICGFNNIGFDYPILHMIIQMQVFNAYDIFLKCQEIINGFDSFDHLVWESEWYINQIDLFKIHHFDNAARRTSLKTLEFNMRSHNIKDLPFPPAVPIDPINFPVLRKYNKHDVSETKKFYWLSTDALEMRAELSQKHDRNFTNHNDTKIGKDYFIMKLGDDVCFYRNQNNKKQPRQTIRQSISLSNIIFNYVKFDRPEFITILDYLKDQTIRETKGVFSNQQVSLEMATQADHSTIKVLFINNIAVKQIVVTENDDKDTTKEKKKLIADISNNRPAKFTSVLKYVDPICYQGSHFIMRNLNTVINGFRYDFGTGGLHGSVSSRTVESDDQFMILDIDVASYYPNIAITNGLFPEHLGAGFCDVYSDVYNQRKQTLEKSAENAMLKLALNGVYGDSGNAYSPFYDPLGYTMAITVNGQLLLCLLAEWLTKYNNVEMIQANTDGLTIKIDRRLENWVNDICDHWESFTNLQLKRVEYNRMFIRDVNNFIGEFKDGSLKRKGTYAHNRDDQRELPWHKNHGGLIIAKAVEAYLVRGVNVESFIRSHDDIMDFMIRAKVPRTSRLVGKRLVKGAEFLDLEEIELDKTTRYFVTDDLKNGLELVKIMPPLAKNPDKFRHIGVDVGYRVCVCNNLDDINMTINYQYYIDKAMKLIHPLIN